MLLLNLFIARLKKWWAGESFSHHLRGFLLVIWHSLCGPITFVSNMLQLPKIGTPPICGQGASKKRIEYILALWLGLASLFGSSIATAAAPGGVNSGLQLWFKADAGTSTTTNGAGVSSWAGQSPATRTASQGSSQPTFVTDAFNFNPALGFNESASNKLDLNSLTGLPADNNRE